MISIIIPVYNGRTVIQRCLNSVQISSCNIKHEILIVDDGSTDNSIETIKRYIKDDVSIIKNAERTGFVEAVIRGVNKAKGDIVVFLNMDTVVEPTWLEELIRPIEKDNTIGITGSKMFYVDNGKIQHAGGYLNTIGLSYHRGDGDIDDGRYDEVMEMQYVCGASMACRKDLLKKIGGFDRGYSPLYYEEIDLAYRFRRAGYKVKYIPYSSLCHYKGYSVHKDNVDIFYFASRARLRYVLKAYSITDLLFNFIFNEIKYFITIENKNKKTLLKAYLYTIMNIPDILLTRARDNLFIQRAKRRRVRL